MMDKIVHDDGYQCDDASTRKHRAVNGMGANQAHDIRARLISNS